eukprot:TRINITY_DN19320_c0_g1_i1.p1 TRINITY_DN19320_c0_g1~~TRINITY_DN19320_c0_g1_i1.p1  ORF type:complete len:296 (-),score=31.86 TRINITY_DN19320_c0_g1_i1:48-935(-)
MVGHLFNPKAHSTSGGSSFAYKSATSLSALFVLYSLISLFAETIVAVADEYRGRNDTTVGPSSIKFANPLYVDDVNFRLYRRPELLGLTQREADFGRRIVASVLLGALIGVERRQPNRPAGVRTMALVSLGSCLFTICSAYAFEKGTQEWDASRISAALPSGVGFIGGAVIFKQSGEVVGLTTATGIWTSCAVGVCCGGELYFVGLLGTAGMVFLLRFGPRHPIDGSEDLQESSMREGVAPGLDSKLESALLAEPVASSSTASKSALVRQRSGAGGQSDAERDAQLRRAVSLSCE